MSATAITPPRPLSAVLAAIDEGAASPAEVARLTGLSSDLVQGAVDHLVRLGRLSAETLTSGCPEGGCGGCALVRSGGPGCPSEGRPTSDRGPVLVTLRRRT